MQYNYKTSKTELVTTEHFVKPSEVYRSSDAKEYIAKVLLEYELIGFRPPIRGDLYLWSPAGSCVEVAPGVYGDPKDSQPRFIVLKREFPLLSLDGWWE